MVNPDLLSKTSLSLIFIIFFALQISKAQELKFSFLTTEQGLSNMNITQIIQDQYGLMWIGTEDGLNVYDGYTFTTFFNDPTDPYSISSNYIHSVVEDQNGNIWVGTPSGLNLYNRRLSRFERFYANPEVKGSISNDQANFVLMDSKNNLWIGTTNGLNLYQRGTSTFVAYLHYPDDTLSLVGGYIEELYEDHKGRLWIGTRSGLCMMNSDGTFKRFNLNNSRNIITSIYEDSESVMWVGTQEDGLFKYNDRLNRFESFISTPIDPSHMIEDQKGSFWMGSTGGLYHLNKNSKDISHYSYNVEDENSLSSNIVSEIFIDKNDRLWVGTRFGGINIYDKNKYAFRHFTNNKLDKNSLSHNNVTSFAEDEEGNVYVGTDGGGLNYFDVKTEKYTPLKWDPNDENSIASNKVLALKLDSKGGLWIGYWGGGLDHYDRKTKKIKHYKNDPKNSKSLGENNVFYIIEDSKGFIWAGTWGKGINKYDRHTDSFTQFSHDPQNENSIGSNFAVSHIIEDHLGKIWIAMETNGGLDMLDPETNKITHFKANNRDGDLSHNAALVVYEDSQKRLWVGTNGGGLNLFDRKTQKFKAYRMSDGLPSETIVGILEDKQQNLWLSTFKGISKFNPQKETFKNYSVADGLQSLQFNRWAFLKHSSGKMLFGGINGFNLFIPEIDKKNKIIPPVYITDFKLFNKPVKIGENEVLKENIFFTKELTLPYYHNFFSFEFTAINYLQTEKNQYKYILEGLQNEWIDAGKERKVSYTNLDPGKYIFKVIASNNDDKWNMDGVQIAITIVPPFWQTWWFKILMILSIIGSALTWYKHRINTIKEQKDILENQVQERTAEVVAQKEELESQAQVLTEVNQEILKHEKKLNELFSEVKDSIRAAQVIQETLLPSTKYIKKHLPESFLYYKPKDVVSGDFYWFDVIEENIIIASVDCTGHGVSGAFMSINGHHLLKQAIFSTKNLKASDILNNLNKGIAQELNCDNENKKVYDGMDIALCILNKKSMKMQYSGANCPLYLVRNNEIIQIKANKFSIGISFNDEKKSFTNHEIDLNANDLIYLFSDGYADQLGGEDGCEKFMYFRFREMLLKMSNLQFDEQLKIVDETFNSWKGNQEQLDDVLIIGFKV